MRTVRVLQSAAEGGEVARCGLRRGPGPRIIISAIGTGAAGTSTVLIIARFTGVGAASVLSPAYIGEATPAGVCGRLISVQQIKIIIGLTAAFAGSVSILAWLLPIALIDEIRRKPILLIGWAGMVVTLGAAPAPTRSAQRTMKLKRPWCCSPAAVARQSTV